MPQPYRLGLTGGIGSGKSTVAQMLCELGAHVIDADAISRSLTAANGAAIPHITQLFGPESMDATGALDRAWMRTRIFHDPQARQQLEGIIHPLVSQQTALHAQDAMDHGARCLVFDVPLLVESPRWRPQLHSVLVVDCEEATQVQRVAARSQLTPDAIGRIMAAQATRAQRRAAADWVIYNDGLDLAALRQEVLSISAQLPL